MRRPRSRLPLDPAIAIAKERARTAYYEAIRVEPGLSNLIGKWWCETLLAVDGQPASAAAEMYRRIAIMLEVMADRSGWLNGRMR